MTAMGRVYHVWHGGDLIMIYPLSIQSLFPLGQGRMRTPENREAEPKEAKNTRGKKEFPLRILWDLGG